MGSGFLSDHHVNRAGHDLVKRTGKPNEEGEYICWLPTNSLDTKGLRDAVFISLSVCWVDATGHNLSVLELTVYESILSSRRHA